MLQHKIDTRLAEVVGAANEDAFDVSVVLPI